MLKPVLTLLAISLMAATAANAQMGGGGGGGGGHGHRGGGGRSRGDPPASSAPAAESAPTARPKATSQIEIIGVVRAIDPATDRITIAYDAVDDLNWPAGTMPFVVGKSALLKGVSVGEKVRFRLESQQIASLAPF